MQRLSLVALSFVAPLAVACAPDASECSIDEDCPEREVCRQLQEREESVCIRLVEPPRDAGPGDEDPVAIESFTADDEVVPRDGSTTLHWSAVNATSCALDEGIGSVPVQGSLEVSPERNTEYTLSCQGGSGPAIARLEVAIAVEVLSFGIDPTALTAGGEVEASWQTIGATSCSLATPAGTSELAQADLDEGAETFSASASGEVTLSCEGAGGPVSEGVTLAVSRIASFTAEPAAAAAGDEVTLSWTAEDVEGCAVSGADEPVEDGEVTVVVQETTTFTLVCEGVDGAAIQASVQVLVLIRSFTAADDSVSSGAGTELSFTVDPEVSACTVNGTDVPTDEPYETGPLQESTEFTLECERADGASASTSLTVLVA